MYKCFVDRINHCDKKIYNILAYQTGFSAISTVLENLVLHLHPYEIQLERESAWLVQQEEHQGVAGSVLEQCVISPCHFISDIEYPGHTLYDHLSLTADSEIMRNQYSVTCRDIANYWLVVQESWFGIPTNEI